MMTSARLVAMLLLGGLFNTAIASAEPPQVEGLWRGRLGSEKSGLRLLLRVSRDPDGTRHALLDSLDQNTKVPVDAVRLDGDKLTLSIAIIGGGYEGKLDPSGQRLVGTWSQRGVPAQPLAFEREVFGTSKLSGLPGILGPPLEALVPTAPTVLTGTAQRFLVYEIELTNLGSGDLALVSVEVLDPSGAVLWKSEAEDLSTRLSRVGRAREGGEADLVLAPGTRSMLFAWVRCPSGKAPSSLVHRIAVREGDGVVRKLDAAPTPVVDRSLEIGPPLRGGNWMAHNGPGDASPHRRAILPTPGRAHLAQRHAIDWVRVGEDGKTYAGDPRHNASYLAYGQEVIAVADATVASVKDGIAENVPGAAPKPTRDSLAGNYVILDLGRGRHALYAHLQPGSLKVKAGDRVKRGQRLALVGNTGNSTEPHLHFHVVDGADPLASEGVPYTIDAYEARGDGKSTPRAHVLPLQNEIVRFAP